MKPSEDAYGRALLDFVEGVRGAEIIERDDGYIETSGGAGFHLAPHRKWLPAERHGLRWIRGRVLDVGAGAGRVALHLQAKGHEVVAIDNSPLAIEACRRRGVRDARVVAIEQADTSLGIFDTILMYGNNLALLGTPTKAKRLLKRFHLMTSPHGRIVGGGLDPHLTSDPDHLSYHSRNTARNRMTGQLRIRVRYRALTTPWLEILFVSPHELEELLEGTGWRLRRTIGDGGPLYVAVIEKS